MTNDDDCATRQARYRHTTHRNPGDIPGCIMLPPDPPERSLLEMQADNEAFHRRVQSYIDSKLDYERVW
jgi:hypothetical protein